MKYCDENLVVMLSEYIFEKQKDEGRAPTYREVMQNFPRHFTSLSKVKRYLDILENKGTIKRNTSGEIETEEMFKVKVKNVPLVGVAACGEPILAIEDIEDTYALPANLFGNGDLVMLRARGDSMIEAGIDDGDLVVIRKQPTAEYGQNVVAMIEGEATIKEYRPEQDRVVLHPRNERLEDIVVSECDVFGVVVGSIKKFF